MKNLSKKTKLTIAIVTLVCLVVVAIGASFALFTYSKKGEKTNTITAGDLYFTYTEDETVGNGIVIENGLPMSDDQGKNSSEYFDFTISSTTGQSTPINYEVVAEKQDTSTFSVNHIKMYLTEVKAGSEAPSSLSLKKDGSVKTFDEYDSTKIIDAKGKTIYKEDILENTSNYEKHFRLRMWISDAATSMIGGRWAYSGKTFSVKVNVYANPTRKTENTSLAMMKPYISLTPSGNVMLDDKNQYIPVVEDFRTDEYKTKITSVTFANEIKMPSSVVASWDVSQESGSGQVMAWVVDDGKGTSTYALTIAGNGEVGSIDLSYLFDGLTNVEQIDLTHLDTSRSKGMRLMFRNCSKLTSLNVSHFDTSNVMNMQTMFYNCKELTSLDVSHFDTSMTTSMYCMFYNCNKLTYLDVSHFDTSKVTSMGYMFSGCNVLTDLVVSNFDTSKVTNMQSMFNDCSSLANLNVSNFDTSNVTNMQSMFYKCSNITNLNVGNFDTSKVTTMNSMFYQCSSLTNLDISNFDTSKVTTLYSMFYNCSNLTSLNVSNFDTSKVTDMAWMFAKCSSLVNLDVGNFNTSSVVNMSFMFQNCSSLKQLDVTNFNTSHVTNMLSMFSDLTVTDLDLGSFDTSNVTNMSYMFSNSINLSNLNLSNFDTSKVTTFRQMFYHCTSLNQVDFRSAVFATELDTYGDYGIFLESPTTITVIVKDDAAKTFIQNALGSGKGTVTIA